MEDATICLTSVLYCFRTLAGGAKSSLGDAKSSLGDAKSSLGDAKSLLLGGAKSSRRRVPFRHDEVHRLGQLHRLHGTMQDVDDMCPPVVLHHLRGGGGHVRPLHGVHHPRPRMRAQQRQEACPHPTVSNTHHPLAACGVAAGNPNLVGQGFARTHRCHSPRRAPPCLS
jgi:hypothetical protein